jgi:hypothetical protein
MNSFKTGDKVRITSNTCNHRIAIGTVVVLGMNLGNGYFQVPSHGCNVQPDDIEHVAQTLEDFEAELAKLDAKAEQVRLRVEYMKKTKSDTFDETEFKVYGALQLLKGKKSDKAKAAAIAKLIKND